MAWAWNACSQELARPLGSLFALFTERVPEQDRLETLQVVGLHAERAARDDGLRHAGSACVWFLKDPSLLVVSTAALSLASLMPSTEEDGMAGPRFVMRWADQCGDGERRAAMFAGLVALGNPDVMALVGDCWRSLDAAGRDVLSRLGVGQVPADCNVDFFLSLAESAVRAAGQEAEGLVPAMGAVLTAGRRASRAWLAGRLQTRVYPFVLVEAGMSLFDRFPARDEVSVVNPDHVEMRYWLAEYPQAPEVFVYNTGAYQADLAYLSALVTEIAEHARRTSRALGSARAMLLMRYGL